MRSSAPRSDALPPPPGARSGLRERHLASSSVSNTAPAAPAGWHSTAALCRFLLSRSSPDSPSSNPSFAAASTRSIDLQKMLVQPKVGHPRT